MQALPLPLPFDAPFVSATGKCLSTIKEDDQFYALDYRRDGSVFAATGKNHTVRHIRYLVYSYSRDVGGRLRCTMNYNSHMYANVVRAVRARVWRVQLPRPPSVFRR